MVKHPDRTPSTFELSLNDLNGDAKELGDKIAVQESDWNCGNLVTPNHKKKPFDDVRVRRA